jgi:hypothetical protein
MRFCFPPFVIKGIKDLEVQIIEEWEEHGFGVHNLVIHLLQ